MEKYIFGWMCSREKKRRYRYPEFDTTGHWHKVIPSQGLSDMLVEELNKDKKGK